MKADRHQPSARRQRLHRLRQPGPQFAQLVVDRDANRLKRAGGRVLTRFAGRDGGGGEFRQLRRGRDRRSLAGRDQARAIRR